VTTIAMIPGAGGDGWFLHPLVTDLRDRGFDAFAVDLPTAGPHDGLAAAADAVVDAIGGRTDVVLVAQSMGGFTAPLVWSRVSVRMVVFVNAMIPLPGETVGEWGENVGSTQAREAAARAGGYPTDFTDEVYFLDGFAPELVREVARHDKPQSDAVFADSSRFSWPDAPIHVIAGRDDRLFPLALQQRVARERVGVEPDVVPGGHLAPLSHPSPIGALVAGYVEELG